MHLRQAERRLATRKDLSLFAASGAASGVTHDNPESETDSQACSRQKKTSEADTPAPLQSVILGSTHSTVRRDASLVDWWCISHGKRSASSQVNPLRDCDANWAGS